MKKASFWVVIVSLALALSFSVSYAQMGSRQEEGNSSSDMRAGQMMSRDMTMDMTVMMKHMNEMMERLSHPMHHMTVTDHRQMYDLGKIMRRMAAEMNELAEHMEKGEITPSAATKMKERMKAIDKDIETLQKKSQ